MLADDPRIMELLENEAYDELINLIEGIWVLAIRNYIVMD
jgi:hypothetical protein